VLADKDKVLADKDKVLADKDKVLAEKIKEHEAWNRILKKLEELAK
jgi:hypothetical protein